MTQTLKGSTGQAEADAVSISGAIAALLNPDLGAP